MVFFILCEFFSLYILFLEDILPNSAQFLFMDFALMNLFGLCLPEIKPVNRISPQKPRTSLWHRELWLYVAGQTIFALLLMIFSNDIIKKADFYIPISKIVLEDDLKNGNIVVDNYKFFDNHFFFVVTCIFALIFLAVDNRADTFRKGFFHSRSRLILFICFFAFLSLLHLLPLLPVEENLLFSWLAYCFRIRVIYSDASILFNSAGLFSIFLIFLAGSVAIKWLSKTLAKRRRKKNAHFVRVNQRLLSKIDSGNNGV